VRPTGLSPAALGLLQGMSFPGNVRELKNLVERAAYRAQGERIEPADLDPTAAGPGPRPAPGGLQEQVLAFERQLLERALAEHGSLVEAAQAVGLGYDQLRRLARKHGLSPRAR